MSWPFPFSLARIHRWTRMDGVRTVEGGEGVTGAMIRARIRVDGRLARGLQTLLGAGLRQIARVLKCSPATVRKALLAENGLKTGGNPQSVQRPNLGPRLGESWPASFQWYEALSPKPQPLGSPTTLGPTTIAHANAPAHEVLVLHTCFPAGYLHPVATVRGVALCLSYPPPPPIDFFYRISQLLCRFALCGFHLSFGLGGWPGIVRKSGRGSSCTGGSAR